MILQQFCPFINSLEAGLWKQYRTVLANGRLILAIK